MRELVGEGWLEERTTFGARERGRSSGALYIQPDRFTALGIQFGASGVHLVATSLGGKILAQHSGTCVEDFAPRKCIDLATYLMVDVHARLQTTRCLPIGIGVAVAGVVDEERGHLNTASRPGWSDIPVAQLFTDRLRGTALHRVPLHLLGEDRLAAIEQLEVESPPPTGVGPFGTALAVAAVARGRFLLEDAETSYLDA
ncbi:hypothetical protein [Roseateles sp.]|uniref:hypothetical protein n=1 Tax=Roseateles sp. TaxID=1971397 RepID=UPI003266314D